MSPIILNANSKFFRVLMFISNKHERWYFRKDWDTCSLLRHCLFVFLIVLPFKAIVIGVLLSLACAGIGNIGYSILVELFSIPPAWYFYPVYLILGAVVIFVLLCLGAIVFAAITLCHEFFIRDREYVAPTSPVGVMYTNWKDKICAKVVIK